LFIRGGNSDYIKSQDESLIKEHFPNVTIKTVSVAGHWVHADNPDELVRVVNQFLR
jgi:esterase